MPKTTAVSDSPCYRLWNFESSLPVWPLQTLYRARWTPTPLIMAGRTNEPCQVRTPRIKFSVWCLFCCIILFDSWCIARFRDRELIFVEIVMGCHVFPPVFMLLREMAPSLRLHQDQDQDQGLLIINRPLVLAIRWVSFRMMITIVYITVLLFHLLSVWCLYHYQRGPCHRKIQVILGASLDSFTFDVQKKRDWQWSWVNASCTQSTK